MASRAVCRKTLGSQSPISRCIWSKNNSGTTGFVKKQTNTMAISSRRPFSHNTTKYQDNTSSKPILPSSVLQPEPTQTQTTATTETASSPNPDDTLDNASMRERLAQKLSSILPTKTATQYQAYGVSEAIYNECKAQATTPEDSAEIGARMPVPAEAFENSTFWYDECGLPPTFSTWVQVTTLYMWLVMVRLRCLERDNSQIWKQHFINHFFYDIEDKMVKKYKIKSGSLRTKYLKEINEQFRGSIGAYDEGFMRGDAVLATAVWRNLWEMSEEVDFEKLAIIVSFIRRVLGSLEKVDDATFLSGHIFFGNPNEEHLLVTTKGVVAMDVIEKNPPTIRESAEDENTKENKPQCGALK